MHRSHWPEPDETDSVSREGMGAPWATAHAVGPRAIARIEDARARAFYRGVLRGRQVWPTDGEDGVGHLWFLVGGTLVEVDSELGGAAAPVVLEVDDPTEVAERCWDAGFSVRVRRDTAGRTALSLIDPFGRRVDLAAREVASSSRLTSIGERR